MATILIAFGMGNKSGIEGGKQMKQFLTSTQSAAYIITQCIAAMAIIAGMQAENQVRAFREESPAYTFEHFEAVIAEYHLDPEEAIRLLRGSK